MHRKAIFSEIQFHFQHKRLYLKNRTKLKRFLLDLFRKERVEIGSLSYVFCSDDYLLKINQTFLHHNFYTDILTFNLSRPKGPIEGEIYISIDRVKENSQHLKQAYYNELHRVIFHGALHLCGYKDKSPKEISSMRKKEDDLLKQYL